LILKSQLDDRRTRAARLDADRARMVADGIAVVERYTGDPTAARAVANLLAIYSELTLTILARADI
jgi:hypothetical protein